MKRSTAILVTVIFLSSFGAAAPAYAQSQRLIQKLMETPLYRPTPQAIITQQYKFKFMYERWVAKAQNYGRGQFPIYNILEPYSKGPDYDPDAENTLNKLYQYAYRAENGATEQEKLTAIDSFKDLLDDHYGNLDVVTAGLSLARQNKELGDVKFLQWLRAGLKERVLKAGPGVDIFTAYDIYTTGEELLVLQSKNANIVDVEEISDGDSFYRIYTLEDKNSGMPSKAYINYTPIMQGIINMKTIEDPFYRYQPTPDQ